jgi:hypothetical protein
MMAAAMARMKRRTRAAMPINEEVKISRLFIVLVLG